MKTERHKKRFLFSLVMDRVLVLKPDGTKLSADLEGIVFAVEEKSLRPYISVSP